MGDPPPTSATMPTLSSLPSLDSRASTRSSSSASSTNHPLGMNGDGFKCFSHLKGGIPNWLADITKVEQSIEQKHREMAKMPQDRPPLFQVDYVPNKREDVISDVVGGFVPTSSSPTNSAPQRSMRWPNLLSKRRSCPGSASSTIGSGPPKFRSRSMVIVYYDAEIQKAFEKLVREISNGRNMIRRGKMSARVEALKSELDDSLVYELAEGEPLPFAMPSFRRAGTRAHPAVANAWSDSSPAVFDKVEQDLEKAQSLCEKAAHQFLRDGDCRTETEDTKKVLQEVLKTSQEELPRYEAMEEIRSQLPKTSPQFGPVDPPCRGPTTGLSFVSIEVDDFEDHGALSLPELPKIPRRAQRWRPSGSLN